MDRGTSARIPQAYLLVTDLTLLSPGVLTKLDIMDRGTSAAHILRNAHIPLRLGYVGVVLRCQEDINNKAPMSEARK